MDYVTDKQMADPGKWPTDVEMFAYAQIMGKDIVVYMPKGWQWYKAKGVSGWPTKQAMFLSNEHRYHFNPMIGMENENWVVTNSTVCELQLKHIYPSVVPYGYVVSITEKGHWIFIFKKRSVNIWQIYQRKIHICNIIGMN